jgi:hypothetical protein
MIIQGSTLRFKPQGPHETVEDYSIMGWAKKDRDEYLAKWAKDHPKPTPGNWKTSADEEVYVPPAGYSDMVDHLANFFNSVRTRKPVVENEVFGHNTAIGCHMSNTAYFSRKAVVWDATSKDIKS